MCIGPVTGSVYMCIGPVTGSVYSCTALACGHVGDNCCEAELLGVMLLSLQTQWDGAVDVCECVSFKAQWDDCV